MQDKWGSRAVIIFLGLVTLFSLGSIAFLSFADKSVPDALIALGTGALGALGGVLAPSPMSK